LRHAEILRVRTSRAQSLRKECAFGVTRVAPAHACEWRDIYIVHLSMGGIAFFYRASAESHAANLSDFFNAQA